VKDVLKIDQKSNCSWNFQLQEILELENESLKNEKLFLLGKNFEESATKYAKIIISEYHLPNHAKTIKLVDVGGII
jgi:hypothetical protein